MRLSRMMPLTVLFSCCRRVLCVRKQPVCIILVLAVVCIALQTFVARQNRVDKELSGPVHQGMFALSVNPELPASQENNEAHLQPQDPHFQDLNPEDLHPKDVNPQDSHPQDVNPKDLLPQHVDNEPPEPTTTRTPTTTMKPVPDKCKEITHIVFLKTHKTASSTILNILYRFGDRRNLTFALPFNKYNQLLYPNFFRASSVEGVLQGRFKEYHIICNHMRFSKSEVAKVILPDSYYFSILRNPVQMMESVFSYFKSLPVFQRIKTLDNFLDSALTHSNLSIYKSGYAHNLLAFDFGLNNNVTANSPDLEQHVAYAISTIERDFPLVLISEYFDESMILLRHTLCWSLEDVVSFKLNTRSNKTVKSLSPETIAKIKKWNALDWRIYLHFNATFWHKLETQIGWERLKEEVSQLRLLQAKLATLCLKDGGAVDASKINDRGLKPFQSGVASIQGYNLNPDLDDRDREKCERFILPELQYTAKLYNKQFSEVRKPVFAPKPVLPKRTTTGLKKL